jgi:hypothetical protein
MEDHKKYFQDLYRNFNERKIDLVISKMTDDIKWANGMDGGFVYGHKGVRDYWIKQFAQVSSKVTPMEIEEENNLVKIKVHQVVHDTKGILLSDEMVYHHFHLQNNKIDEFNIGPK